MLLISANRSGGWLAAAAPGRALLVEAVAAADAERLLAALHAPEPIPAALDVLTAGGFSAMPAFALLEYRGQSAHYVVRGGVRIEFSGPGGAPAASGEGITTWSEQLVSGVDGFVMAAGPASAEGLALPLADGVVPGDRIELRAGDAGAAATQAAAASAPATNPVAVPPRTSTPAPAPAEVSHETLLPEDTGLAPVIAPMPGALSAVLEDSMPAPEEGTTSYDHLFGMTVMKSVESAAVRPAPEGDEDAPAEASSTASSSAPASDDVEGDHDGLTMMSSEIAEMRRRAAASAETQAPAPAEAAPAPEQTLRLLLPDGRSEPLDRPVIIGRAPSASKVSGTELPKLLTVGGTDPDISRSHVRITVEGGTAVITDLHSRNGTVVTLPGRSPQKLREGEPTSVLAGTLIDLGGGVHVTVVEGPGS
ncbi:MAG: FHA domain-containing protein [Microbacteriaceae bacterium]|nr:FHA domain-containing protein [Microbacteriaceae bacterium]